VGSLQEKLLFPCVLYVHPLRNTLPSSRYCQ
jgi:hypothetical protein